MPEYWDAPHRDHADHIRRLRKTPGAEHLPDDPNKYEWLLGNDGSGEYNLLERGGVDATVRRGSVLFYVGHVTSPLNKDHPAFRYEEVEPESDSDGEPDDDGHGPDAPDGIAPRKNVDIWVLKLDDIWAHQIDGNAWATYGAGSTLMLRGHLTFAEPNRHKVVLRILRHLHPLEYLQTDSWDYFRIHNFISLAELCSLSSALPILPPPSGVTPKVPRLFWYPGCLHHVDKVIAERKRKAIEFRRPPESVEDVKCSSPQCSLGHAYNRSTGETALCLNCNLWFHVACCERQLMRIAVPGYQREFKSWSITALAIRRQLSKDDSDYVWFPTVRGLALRVDCPVRSWERVSCAVVETLGSLPPDADWDQAQFREDCIRRIGMAEAGPRWPPVSRAEAENAFDAMAGGKDAGECPILKCPECSELM